MIVLTSSRGWAVLRCATLILLSVGVLACSTTPPGPPTTSATPAEPARPRVAVDAERQDLGLIGLGEEAVAVFLVTNRGSAPLVFATPVLPRGTSVDGLVAELSPGQSVSLRFRIDTLTANAEPLQRWTLVTNDPDRPRLALAASIDVRPFVAARPGYARYIVVQQAREGTITQTIGALDGADFRVLRVESPAPSLRVSFREARPDERQPVWTGRQWRVESTLATDAPVGALTGSIVVHTDHPRQSRVVIPVSGFVRPMFAVTPPEARMGDLDRRQTRPAQFVVKNFAEEEIALTGVSTDVSAVRAEIEEVERGRSWRLKLFPAPSAPPGPFEGKLVLHTASPKLPSFEVPVSGRLVGN